VGDRDRAVRSRARLARALESVSPVCRELPPCPPVRAKRRFTLASRAAAAVGAGSLARDLAFAAVGVGRHAMRSFPGYNGRPPPRECSPWCGVHEAHGRSLCGTWREGPRRTRGLAAADHGVVGSGIVGRAHRARRAPGHGRHADVSVARLSLGLPPRRRPRAQQGALSASIDGPKAPLFRNGAAMLGA
jgi:hypothetical protein